MKSIIFLIYFVLFLTAISCKKNANFVKLHENYFPMEKGVFVEYEVTEIKHNNNAGIHDTNTYLIKTLIGDTLIDNSGRIARKFSRFLFNNSQNEYKIKDLWTTIVDQSRVEIVEENKRIIKLVLAPTLKKEWDINAFNIDEPILAKYDNLHSPATMSNFNFDSTLTVIEEKFDNLIEFKRKYEIYAKNVGMIYKCYKDFEINEGDTTIPQSGVEIYYKIKNYGKE